MKKILKLIKKIVMSLCIIYAFNILTSKIGFYIPINIYTISVVTIFDFFGLMELIILGLII